MCSITGMGERLHKVLGQIGSKLWFPWQQKPLLTYNGENNVSTFSRLFVIRYFLYLQVTRTCIKSRISSEFLPDRTTDDGVIRPWAFPLTLNGENGVSIFSQLLWIQISSNLQEMKDRHKISDRFEFWSYLTSHFGVTWPFSGEKNDVSSFSQSPLIGSLLNLQVMRTGIKSSNKFEFGSDRIIQFGVICPWAPIFTF